MNWEAIGATSEFLGAIAVVATLVYLARQLKMTRQVDQVGAFQAIFDGFTHHTGQFFSAHDDLALRGLKDRQALSESERLKFDHLLENVLNQAEMTHGAVQAGLMSEADLENLDWWFREKLFCYPGAREWLENFAGAYPEPYLKRLRSAAAAAARDA